MKYVRYLMAAMVAVLLAIPALAQTAPAPAASTTIDFMPLVNLLLPAVGVLLAAVVGWAARKYLGVKMDDQAVAVVNDAMQKGLAFATAKLQAVPLTVDVKSPVIAAAADYAMSHAGDALARLGVSPDQLAQKLVARYFDPSVPVGVTDPKPTAT